MVYSTEGRSSSKRDGFHSHRFRACDEYRRPIIIQLTFALCGVLDMNCGLPSHQGDELSCPSSSSLRQRLCHPGWVDDGDDVRGPYSSWCDGCVDGYPLFQRWWFQSSSSYLWCRDGCDGRHHCGGRSLRSCTFYDAR
jgi:hypothetical protein